MIIYDFKLLTVKSIIGPSTNYWGFTVTLAIIVVIVGLAAIAYQDIAS
tara:strand:+ start:286 stop:429 length:144 start_codon:yes stop_codon:yes gene_type:complete